MADPDADSDDEFENSTDYYSVLNVLKDVRIAAFHLCSILV